MEPKVKETVQSALILSIILFLIVSIIYQIKSDNTIFWDTIYQVKNKLMTVMLCRYAYCKCTSSLAVLTISSYGIHEILQMSLYIIFGIYTNESIPFLIYGQNPAIDWTFSISSGLFILSIYKLTPKRNAGKNTRLDS